MSHAFAGRADAGRLGAFIDGIAAIGAEHDGGCTRLAFTREERLAHELFAAEARAIGMQVEVDAIGNSFAWLGDPSAPAFVVGSHLDSVPHGGRFDGVAGVAAGLEVARLLAEHAPAAGRRFCAVAFAAEEGARFGMPCIGSRVATGVLDAGGLHEIKDRDGVSVAASASAVGLDPARVSDGHLGRADLRGFIELHIEQGIVLETRGRSVGLVDAIAGSTRLLLRFTGRADHSGATPMALRRDALTAASELVVDIEAAARRHPTSVATVGRLEVSPGSITTVPGEVMLTIDFRDVDSERQRELADSVLDEAIRISRRRALDVSASLLSDQSPVLLHKPLRELLAGALGTLGVPFSVLPSGAMHDAAYMARRTPSALLFVPSRDGVSHSRDEHSELAHIARGCEAIATAIVDDELRQQPAFPHAEEGERA